ncbi:MAG: ABC transporter ATP-binding protein [Clostridia bacterium]|nr:ABC transporter ATP-binding protein [Clostridia bacterium]
MSEHLLEVKNLQTNFRTGGGIVQAVRGVDLYVDAGEFLGIIGESGCGKSVTMMSILHLLEDNAAVRAETIKFNGVNLQEQSKKQIRKLLGSQIGMIFQDPMTSLNPLYTIGNQLTEPLRQHLNMSRSEASKRAVEMLQLVGINEPEKRLKQYPHELSGGMRQRAMIAVAMCCNPKLLIADEPTTALDVTIQAQIMELMADMQKRFSTATILITHDLGVIASVCTRVMVMYGGKIMEEGSVDDIFYRPAHPYTEGLLRSVPNDGTGSKEKLIPIPGSPPDLMNPPAGCPFAARCPKAMKICALAPAQLQDVGPDHRAACWLLHPQAKNIQTRGADYEQ